MNLNDHHPVYQGVVYKKTSGSFRVYTPERMVQCVLSSRMRKPSRSQPAGRIVPEDTIAVGDQVLFIEAGDGTGQIVEVLPRQNKISRQSAVPMPGAYSAEQVIVANVGLMVPVFAAANPAPRWNLLDRYLVTAESLNLAALICITKLDLAQTQDGSLDPDLTERIAEYRKIGYPVMLVSAATGEGILDLKQALNGHIAVFMGKSGVGKTTLLNALQPGLGLRVNEISRATGKGKHTTTHLEMFPLDSGGAVIDTPGIREFGLWDVDEDDLALYFPEMRPFVGQCKFGLDCQHDEEPGCAVRKAVVGGKVSPHRYQSYMRMKEDV